MADQAASTGDQPAKKKGGVAPILIGLFAALLLGGATAFAVMSGLVPIPGVEEAPAQEADASHSEELVEMAPSAKYVGFEPLTVTFVQDGAPRQLRINLSIATSEAYVHRVEEEKPRILDSLNTLLRAIDDRDLSDPSALDRLRAQMLRRIRISTDPTAIQDLLITEYVIF